MRDEFQNVHDEPVSASITNRGIMPRSARTRDTDVTIVAYGSNPHEAGTVLKLDDGDTHTIDIEPDVYGEIIGRVDSSKAVDLTDTRIGEVMDTGKYAGIPVSGL